MTDLHLHTDYSYDSQERAENYLLAAQTRGITRLGFAEHFDYDVFLEQGGKTKNFRLTDVKQYLIEMQRLSRKFPSVKILKGIELGFSPAALPHYQMLVQENQFDYVILSVHTVPGRGDCYYPAFFTDTTKKQAYEEYLNAVLESVRSDLNYQIVGHLGYIARYAPYPDKCLQYRDFSSLIDEILKELIARGKYLEINTSSKGAKDLFLPAQDILDRYLELGGERITFGSDAHDSQRLAEHIDAVKTFLYSRGITHTYWFEEGIPRKEKI